MHIMAGKPYKTFLQTISLHKAERILTKQAAIRPVL